MGTVIYSGETFTHVEELNVNLSLGEIKLLLDRSHSSRIFRIQRGNRIKLETPKDNDCHIERLQIECSRPILYLTGNVKNLSSKYSHVFVTGDIMKVEKGKVHAGDMEVCNKEFNKAISAIDSVKGRESRFRLKGIFKSVSVFAGQCNCELVGTFMNVISGGTLCIEGNLGTVKCREVYCNRVAGYGIKADFNDFL